MPMVKSKVLCSEDMGTEVSWCETGVMTEILRTCVWKLVKDMPARKLGFPYQWAVHAPKAGYKARGYARNFKQACKKATAAKAYILANAVITYIAPDHLSDKLDNITAR